MLLDEKKIYNEEVMRRALKLLREFKEGGEIPSEKKKIYIVDDDESVCRALKLFMATYDFEVNTFSSAEEFLSAVPNSIPGCLILDIHLPGLNGWDMQQKLMKTGYNCQVIIITGDKDGRFKSKALKAGAVGFLQKPFDDYELLDLIDSVS